MCENEFDNVRESSAHYGDGESRERDPKTGRFVPAGFKKRKAKKFDEAVESTFKKFDKTFKKLAE